jgi:tight adherence protein B
MTPLGWLAVAVAVAIGAGISRSPARIGALAAAGRLTAPQSRASAVRSAARSRIIATGTSGAGAAAVGAVAVVVIAALAGPVLAIAAAVIAWTAWVVGRDVVRARTTAGRRRDLAAAVRMLIVELESGARASAALTAAGDVAPAYGAVFRGAASAAAEAHDAGAALATDPDTRAVGLAWRLGEETGAALAGVLERVAADLADADEQRRTVAIALSGPRASAALLTALPLLGIGLGAAMGAQPWAFLFGPPAGRIVCSVGIVLDAAGVLWMRRILHRAEGP